jgi:hypothetical protein
MPRGQRMAAAKRPQTLSEGSLRHFAAGCSNFTDLYAFLMAV